MSEIENRSVGADKFEQQGEAHCARAQHLGSEIGRVPHVVEAETEGRHAH
jgi:hypothetical protein